MWWLMKAMFLEEFRLQSSYSNRMSTMGFPVLLVVMAFIVAVSLPRLESEVSTSRILMGVHTSIVLYGLAVGAFAFLGREMVERRWGHASFIQRTFMVFFLKDLLYYIFMTLLPLTVGLLLAIPITGFRVTSVLLLFGTLTASFCYAISFSFLMSSVYVRSRAAFMGLTLSVITVVVASGVLGLFDDVAALRAQLGQFLLALFV